MKTNRFKYTIEQIEEFANYYNYGEKTLKETAEYFNISYDYIKNILTKLGYREPSKSYDSAKNSNIDHNYFEIIDSDKKAYFLGLLMSDGYIETQTYNKAFGIALQLEDKYIIEELILELKSQNKLNEYKNSIKFSARSGKIYEDLVKWNFCESKSNSDYNFPNIPVEYQSAFIRGYFDGDGCITIKSTGYSVTSFCCNSKIFLDDLRTILEENNIECRPVQCQNGKSRTSPIFILYISKSKAQNDFANYIYNNAEIYLKRKFEKFEKIKNKSIP